MLSLRKSFVSELIYFILNISLKEKKREDLKKKVKNKKQKNVKLIKIKKKPYT